MKKIVISLLAFFSFCFSIVAQDFQGKAVYQSKSTIDANLDGRQISEEQKQRIQQRLKSFGEQSFELNFDRVSSMYVKEEKLETPSAGSAGGRGGFRFAGAFGAGDGELYKNIQDQSYANQTELFGKVFLVKDSLTNWEWKLGSETKKIGNYTCYKATATKKVDTLTFNRFRRFGPRGRDNQNENRQNPKDSIQKDSTASNSLLSRISEPKDRVVTAWYTPEIPVSQGPGNYWGLPGLILEVNDERTAILCSKIILNTDEKVAIQAPSKGKKVSQKEFDKIRAEKLEEMSERFRGGNNRRGGGNGIRIRG